MAAALSCGPPGVVSHFSAAADSGILDPRDGWPHVTTPTRLHRRRGLILHSATLAPDEIRRVDGLPLTCVPRTLLDLATVLPPWRLERAMNEAEVRRLTDPLSLPDLLERYPRRHGTAAIRSILAAGRLGQDITKEELEARFRALLVERGISMPAFNASVSVEGAVLEADCLWRRERLIVELDGSGPHNTPAAIERDKRRDRRLAAAGWLVMRVTWRQLHDEPEAVERDLRRTLAARRALAASPVHPLGV